MKANHNDGSEIVIGNYTKNVVKNGRIVSLPRTNSEYFNDTVVAHETGHAIHAQKGIIDCDKRIVRQDFADHFSELQKIIGGKEPEISNYLHNSRKNGTQNDREQIVVLADILASLTGGKFGWGHELDYYNRKSFPEAEVFAHSVSLLKTKNDFVNGNEDIKAVVDLMKKKILDWL